MLTRSLIRLVLAYVLAAALASSQLFYAPDVEASPGGDSTAEAAEIAPRQFLPWPPAIPVPVGPVWTGSAPSGEPADGAAGQTLRDALAAVQAAVERLRGLIESLRAAAAAALAQIVLPLPIGLPGGATPADVLTQLSGLPDAWRSIIAGGRAKLQPPNPADPAAARHERDIAGSTQLSHAAATIAAADQQVISGAAEQEIAASSTQALASAAAHDTALPQAVAAAQSAADVLASGVRDLPSSRAGIELLVAGAGAGLRSQAALTAVLADRIAGLMQQSAQLSGQVGGLASTVGIFTERALQRDRDALDARLGLADAARGSGELLRQVLLGAGEPADEIRIVPLY